MWLTKTLSTYIVYLISRINTKETEKCDFSCASTYDPVCGMVQTAVDTYTIKIYQNLCTLLLIDCSIGSAVVKQVPDELCGLKEPKIKTSVRSGRRAEDFSIVGAHQACNHTCPTYCTDVYEPACAGFFTQKYNNDAERWDPIKLTRPMINHCHVDLFSCSMGLNVTLEPLARCYMNPSGLMFMSQVAGMRSLGLLDEGNEHAENVQRSWRRLFNDFVKERRRTRRRE